jgi:hypothetical protein
MNTYDMLHRIQQTPKLSQTQKGVLIALATFADMDGRCHPSMAKLGLYVSVTDRAVRSALRDLEERGLVASSRRDNATTKYQIQWNKLPERNDRNVDPPGTRIRPEGGATRQEDPEGGVLRSGGGRIYVPEGADPGSAEVTIQVTNPKQPSEATILVPPVPVATPTLPEPEPPACAPPQAIPTSAPESTAKVATNTQPALFGAATADTAGSPKKQKKAAPKVDNSEAVAKVWSTYRKHHERCGEKIPTSDARLIETALKDWTAEQLCKVVEWAHTSQHERALFLREGKYTAISNLFVGGKILQRLEMAEAEEGKGPGSTLLPATPQEDPAAIWDSIIKRRSSGIRILPDDIPPRTQDAIRAAGGWNQLGMLNDYTEKQAKASFIAALRNQPMNGHQRTA